MSVEVFLFFVVVCRPLSVVVSLQGVVVFLRMRVARLVFQCVAVPLSLSLAVPLCLLVAIVPLLLSAVFFRLWEAAFLLRWRTVCRGLWGLGLRHLWLTMFCRLLVVCTRTLMY